MKRTFKHAAWSRAEPGAATGCDARRGIALIVVLGFLAVLLIMGVGFAVYMRTERMVARYYHQFVAARELVHAGLARAIDTVDQELEDTLFPPWTILRSGNAAHNDVLDTVAAEAYTFMPWIPQLDEAPRGTSGNSQPAGAQVGDVLLNLSDRSHALVRTTQRPAPLNRGFDNTRTSGDEYKIVRASNTPVWHNVATNGPLVQRISFSAVNVSGLLDAHVIGRSPRQDGTDPGELAVADMPELQGQAAPYMVAPQSHNESLLRWRAEPSTSGGWHRFMYGYRYDTQEDFYNLSMAVRQYWGTRGPIFDRGTQFPGVFHFSYFPTGLDRMGFFEAGYDDAYPTGFFGAYYDGSQPARSFFRNLPAHDPEAFYARSGWWDEANNQVLMRLDIGGTNVLHWAETLRYRNLATAAGELFDRALFDTAFAQNSSTESVRTNMAAWAFNSLVGYVDEENVPRSLNMPNPSSVPMLNEFAVTNNFALEVEAQEQIIDLGDGTTITNWVPHRVRVTAVVNQAGIEAWYPMATSSGETYALRADMEYTNQSNPAYPAGMMPSPATFSGEIDVDIIEPEPDTFRTHVSEQVLPPPAPPPGTLAQYGFDYEDGHIRVDYFYDIAFRNIRIVREEDNAVVDRVEDVVLEVRHEISAPVPQSETPQVTESSYVYSLEAVDPRWNWDIENRAMWRVSTNRHTLGTYNAATVDYLAGIDSNLWILDENGEQTVAQYAEASLPLSPPDDITLGEDPVMFVANRPLRRVGELGYINYYPWRSFRITGDDPLHPVVDYFSVNRPRAGFAVRDLQVGTSYDLTGEVRFNVALYHLSGMANDREERAVVRPLNLGSGAGAIPFPGGEHTGRSIVHAAGYIYIDNAPRSVTFQAQSSGSGGMALYVHRRELIRSGTGSETVTYEFPYNGLFPVDLYYWNPSSANRSLSLSLAPDLPVLSVFPTTGFLNPNTENLSVLTTAFQNIPLDSDYEPTPTRAFQTWNAAENFAGQFAASAPFTRPSQVATAPAIRNASGIDRFERQALAANLIEMMHLRGQVFVIPVAGQVWNSETDEVIADQRAVAVVWRDPFPDDQGHHRSIVRVFQWLFH